MRILIFISAILSSVSTYWIEPQKSLGTPRAKVPGENPAYHCSKNLHDDLFWPQDLTIMPDPIQTNRRFFVYLYGHVANLGYHDPTLADATLTVNLTFDKTGERESATAKLTEYEYVITRDSVTHEWGGPLKWGGNEILADYVIWSINRETGNYTAGVEARMPDGRRLFCFEATLFLEGSGPW